jgi:hypothetical protein
MHETEGYLIPRDACFLDKLELMPHESALLNLLSELALRKGGSAFSADLMSALQKLRFDTPAGGAAPTPAGSAINFPPAEPGEAGSAPPPPEDGAKAKKKRGRPPKKPAASGAGAGGAAPQKSALESSLLDLDLASSLRTDPNLELLAQGLLANQRVAFTYHSMSSGEKRRRELDPYGIGFARGAWYVVGLDHKSGETRQFRLDRMEGAAELVGPERAFKPPRDFRVTQHIEKPLWEMADRPPVEAEIEVARDLAFFVEDLIAGKGSAEPGPNDSVVVKLDVRDRAAFVRWVLAHLRHVKIRNPRDLQDELAAAIVELRRRYAEP